MDRVIHTYIVMDIETGETLEDETFLYDGDVAECGGGGGGGDTTTVDYGYNARMATISEKQQEQADTYFNEVYLPHYMPLEIEQAEANRQALPYESDAYITGLKNMKSINNALNNGLKEQQGVTSEFINASRKGVDVNERMALAQADVVNSWKGQQDAMNRSAARMGVNPNSGRYMGTQVAAQADRAAQMAGARTAARIQAEDENYQRLGNAANLTPGYMNTISGLYSGISLLKS